MDKEEVVADMMALAVYVTRLDFTDGNFKQAAKRIELLTSELMAARARLLEEEPETAERWPRASELLLSDCPKVKKELCQVVSELDKRINSGR